MITAQHAPRRQCRFPMIAALLAGWSGDAAVAQPVFTLQPAPATICTTSTATFTVIVDFAGGGNAAIQWRFNGQNLNHGDRGGRVAVVTDLSNTAAAVSTLTINQANPATDAGAYSVIATTSDAGSTPSNSVVLAFHPAPAVSPTATPTSACLGHSFQLAANATGGSPMAPIVRWTVIGMPDGGATLFTPFFVNPSPLFTPIEAGTYTVQAEVIDPACFAFASATISVIARPVLSASPTPITAATCRDVTIQLTGNASGGHGTYTHEWFVEAQPPGSTVTIQPSAAAANPTFAADVSGEYIIRLRVSAANCNAVVSAPLTVSVSEQTEVTAYADDDRICLGQSTLLVSESEPVASTHSWSILSGPDTSLTQLDDANVSHPNFTPAAAGDYVFQVTVTNGNCVPGIATFEMSVPQTPTVTASASPTSTCVGLATQLLAQTTGSNSQFFTWTIVAGPDDAPTQFSSTSTHNPTFTPTAPTTVVPYRINVRAVDGFCGTVHNHAIDIAVSATVNASPMATPATTCVGIPTTLSAGATGGDGTYTYTWSITSGPTSPPSQISDVTAASPTFTPAIGPADYTIGLVTSDGSCDATEPIYFLPVHSTALLAVAPSAEYEVTPRAYPMPLHANRTGGNTPTFQWTIASQPQGCTAPNSIANATSADPVFTPGCVGQYVLALAADDDACPDANADLPIEVVEYTAAPEAAPQTGCVNQPIALGANITQDYAPYLYTWSIVSGPNTAPTQLSSTTAASPTFTPAAAGSYRLGVTVNDEAGILPVVTGEVDIPVSTAGPVIQPNGNPLSLARCEGESAQFTVAATGTSLMYQWQHDNSDIAGATSPTLMLSAVLPTDAGNYRCVVSNGCGSAVSTDAALTVEPATTATLLFVARENSKLRDASITGCTITPQLTDHGQMGPPVTGAVGFAVEPSTGIAFVAVRTGSSPRTFLAEILNPWTGESLPPLDMGQPIADIAFHPNGTLYAIRGNATCTPPQCAATGLPGQLYTVNIDTGQLTTVSPNIVLGDDEGHAIAFDSIGRLYHHGLRPGVYSRLTRRALATPNSIETLRDYATNVEWTAMIIDADGFLAVSRSSPNELWSIDPVSYVRTVLGPVQAAGAPNITLTGLGFVELLHGDWDFDGDIDLEDFNQFGACAIADTFPIGCRAFDFDGDIDVDLVDWGVFQSRFAP